MGQRPRKQRPRSVPVVVDANVVVYMLLEGEKSAEARLLCETCPDWVCPTILRHEVMNVWTTYERAGGVSREGCLALTEASMALLRGRELEVDPVTAVRVAMDLVISAYDAEYVAAAMALQAVLVTEDREVLEKAGSVAVSLGEQTSCSG